LKRDWELGTDGIYHNGKLCSQMFLVKALNDMQLECKQTSEDAQRFLTELNEAWAERNEALKVAGISKVIMYRDLRELIERRDALLAENRALTDWVEHPTEEAGTYSDGSHEYRDRAKPLAPLTAASVERVKRLEAVKTAFESEWKYPGPTCTCDEAYKSRGLEDPGCFYHQSPATFDALSALGEGA
jgi:hypothetical protein